MNISDDLLCLYSARVTEQGDTYTVEVPKQEIQQGSVQAGETCRVALISSTGDESASESTTRNEELTEGDSRSRGRDAQSDPPVSEGEMREVKIESLGDKGDGITKIDGGYVVIVPDTEVGERVTIRLDDVRENVGFAEVVKRQHDPIQEQ
ncbi:TRAM domain-containing protein [Halobellus ruber]|uniref:TRAM domain-containing protein n=1 Tax=Halobellus ruber TaxID=2761102 RepID=A0A7J9SJM0_9EURY|nr:TRAM domain-containing protein [Halobellus ruber]MBB6645211.1 TRAM domain-containing protein [Halobellus ruber]